LGSAVNAYQPSAVIALDVAPTAGVTSLRKHEIVTPRTTTVRVALGFDHAIADRECLGWREEAGEVLLQPAREITALKHELKSDARIVTCASYANAHSITWS
jgi:hypothetical protein